jgi:broad specificity phosphatase PhoE
MERAQETAEPISLITGLTAVVDDRLTEAENKFQGMRVAVGDGALRNPKAWPKLVNPFKPSWGEPYTQVAARMAAATRAARAAARGHEAVCVSHQLPIWILRLAAERRHLWHDPRRRTCALASLTTLTFDGDALIGISYAEPVGAG